jgi:hypothetical protein
VLDVCGYEDHEAANRGRDLVGDMAIHLLLAADNVSFARTK